MWFDDSPVFFVLFLFCVVTSGALKKRSRSFVQDKLPLAVVGSNTIIEVNGKRVRGRQYPWGVAEGREVLTRAPRFIIREYLVQLVFLFCLVENSDHCDFTILRDMLIRYPQTQQFCFLSSSSLIIFNYL